MGESGVDGEGAGLVLGAEAAALLDVETNLELIVVRLVVPEGGGEGGGEGEG